MRALDIVALAAVLVAGLVTFIGFFLWLDGLVKQAEADLSLEALSSNREKERF